MLRPTPSYCVFSLLANKSRRKVGSRLSASDLLAALPDVLLPGFELTGRGTTGDAACALESGEGGPPIIGINSYAPTSRAMTPRAMAQVVCFLFSNPSFTTQFLSSDTFRVSRSTSPDLAARL